MSDLGPADGRQKMRLLDELFENLTPIPEEGPPIPCRWIPGEAQPSCGFDPNCPECNTRCPGCGCEQHRSLCDDCGCLDARPPKESDDDDHM